MPSRTSLPRRQFQAFDVFEFPENRADSGSSPHVQTELYQSMGADVGQGPSNTSNRDPGRAAAMVIAGNVSFGEGLLRRAVVQRCRFALRRPALAILPRWRPRLPGTVYGESGLRCSATVERG